jgi:hypothetical protein
MEVGKGTVPSLTFADRASVLVDCIPRYVRSHVYFFDVGGPSYSKKKLAMYSKERWRKRLTVSFFL